MTLEHVSTLVSVVIGVGTVIFCYFTSINKIEKNHAKEMELIRKEMRDIDEKRSKEMRIIKMKGEIGIHYTRLTRDQALNNTNVQDFINKVESVKQDGIINGGFDFMIEEVKKKLKKQEDKEHLSGF